MFNLYVFISLLGALVFIAFNFEELKLYIIIEAFMRFAVIFLCFTAIHITVCAIVALCAPKNKKWENINNIYRKVMFSTINLFLHIMKAKVQINGLEKIPENQRFLMVSNHISIFDPIIAIYYLRDKDLAFVSKKENIKIPLAGRLMLASGCISLDRENNRSAVQSIEQASEHISNNISSIGIYPEGKINKSDSVLLPFHSGSFKIAVKTNSPIIVTSICNTNKLCKRFLFTHTDIPIDIIRVIQPEEFAGMKTSDISKMVWNEIHSHLDSVNQQCEDYDYCPEK